MKCSKSDALIVLLIIGILCGILATEVWNYLIGDGTYWSKSHRLSEAVGYRYCWCVVITALLSDFGAPPHGGYFRA